jgi:hypothetical protein
VRSLPKLRGRRAILMLILLVAWIATFFQGNPGAAADRSCYEHIQSELRQSGSISVTDVTRSGGGPVWAFNVAADGQSPQGAATGVEYACRNQS